MATPQATNGTLSPRNDFVLLKEVQYESYERYKGLSHIVVPTKYAHGPEDRPIMGTILAKGEACTNISIPVGAMAITGKWTGARFFRDGIHYVLVKETDILGLLDT